MTQWLGFLSGLSLSGLAAVLTFIFALRRDRRQRLTQAEISRIEDLRSVFSQYIAMVIKKREFNRVKENYSLIYSSGLSPAEIESRYKILDLDEDITRLFTHTKILVDLSYQGRISDLLMEAMEKGNIESVLENGTIYLNKEWARILKGTPPKFNISPNTQ